MLLRRFDVGQLKPLRRHEAIEGEDVREMPVRVPVIELVVAAWLGVRHDDKDVVLQGDPPDEMNYSDD